MTGENSQRKQRLAVRRRFHRGSAQWGRAYTDPVADVGQLDLALRAQIVRRMLSRIAESRSVTRRLKLVDVGCGTGHVLAGLSTEQYDVLAMDFAEGMVRRASTAHPEVRFMVGDAANIPLVGESVDVVTLIGVLEYIPAANKVLAGIARLLRPGGWLVVSFPNARSLFRHAHRLERTVTTPIRSAVRKWRCTDVQGNALTESYRHYRWTERRAELLLQAQGLMPEWACYCTYGLKTPGLERLKLNMAFCRWASERYSMPGVISRSLAWTIVMAARKDDGAIPAV